jgi:hypothetical protein
MLICPDFFYVVIYFCWLVRTHASRVLCLTVVGFTLLEFVTCVTTPFSPCLLLPGVDLSWVALFYFCANALCALVHWYHSVPVKQGLSPVIIESGCMNLVAWIWIFALVDLVVAPFWAVAGYTSVVLWVQCCVLVFLYDIWYGLDCFVLGVLNLLSRLVWVIVFYGALVHWYRLVPVRRGLELVAGIGLPKLMCWFIWLRCAVLVFNCYPNFIWLSSVEILICALLFGLVRSYSGFFHVTWWHLWSLIWIRVWLNWYLIGCSLLRFWWGVPHARDEFMKYIK